MLFTPFRRVSAAWADELSPHQLDELLSKCEHEVQMQQVICQEQLRRGPVSPQRSAREAWLWRRIAENWIAGYETELHWVQGLRRDLAEPAAAAPEGNSNLKGGASSVQGA